jgi:RecA/RadA recombinase
MTSLFDRLRESGSVKISERLSESAFFKAKDFVKTQLPILNLAFSGEIDGGFSAGLTILSGESKTFKTLLSLYCLKAYFDKYPDAVCLFYDSEFGTTPAYLKKFGIDPERIIHIPIEHVEQLKFDIVKRLETIKKDDKVFILIDSLGALASKKEVEDANDEKSVADMSRAKAIRSLFRIITPHLTLKDLPCFVVNHVYQTMEMFSKTVIPGGTAVTYSANQIFVITKAKEVNTAKEIIGYRFTINIFKSRLVKENAKFPFIVLSETGIDKYSGMLDFAIDKGYIKQSGAWYTLANLETGEISEESKKVHKKDIPDDFYENLLNLDDFKKQLNEDYKL